MLVFSKEKCIEDAKKYFTEEELNALPKGWVTSLDGLAVDALIKQGYSIDKEWCVDKLTIEDYEKALEKAVKMLNGTVDAFTEIKHYWTVEEILEEVRNED